MNRKTTKSAKNTARTRVRVITGFVVVIVLFVFIRIRDVRKQIDRYTPVVQELNERIEEESAEISEIREEIEKLGSDEYIEDMARKKLGLVYDGETVFRKEGR